MKIRSLIIYHGGGLFFSFLLLFLCTGCGKQPPKQIIDRNTQIDCELSNDEYAASGELIHAREIARRNQLRTMHDEPNDASNGSSLNSPEMLACLEAKLADLPLPLGAEPIDEYCKSLAADAQQFVLGYISEQSVSELAAFFDEQMAMYDWRKGSDFESEERLLVFEKHDRLCIVSLRKQDGWFYRKGYTQITLYLNVAR